jgi:lipopolysaccharide biosynthesis glycosyltransferase
MLPFPPTPPRISILERLQLFLDKILCAFIPFRKGRQFIHYYLLRTRIYPGRPPLPVKKRPGPINVAVCFDGNMARPAGVALASLLVNSKNRASYNIHCVADDSVSPEMRAALTGLVREFDPDSTLRFLAANHDFDQCLTGRVSLAAYYRLMLPGLLPELDEIIYFDVDALFLRDFIELADLDLGDNLLAGVQERSGGYINSGFLVMNLARLRSEKHYETWPEIALRERYETHDQDLLNYNCQGRILHLPVKYNFLHLCHHIYRKGVVSPEDHHELKYKTVMLHYAGDIKPWQEKSIYMSRLWWEYARLTPFYEDLRAQMEAGG